MSNIPPWYDYEERRMRDDIWPFQKGTRMDRKALSKQRLCRSYTTAMKHVPNGWSMKWRSRRDHYFRIESGRKRIKAPFPKNQAGMVILGAALWTAHQIGTAIKIARASRTVPAAHIQTFGFWRHYAQYHANHRASKSLSLRPSPWLRPNLWSGQQNLYRYGISLPHTKRAWRAAHISCAREVLRFMSTPRAWSVPRKDPGGPVMCDPAKFDRRVLEAVAYRKLLIDYLSVNGATVNEYTHPLPTAGAKLAAKTTPPVNQP